MHTAQLKACEEARSTFLSRTRGTQAIIVGLFTFIGSSVVLLAQSPGHVELRGNSVPAVANQVQIPIGSALPRIGLRPNFTQLLPIPRSRGGVNS